MSDTVLVTGMAVRRGSIFMTLSFARAPARAARRLLACVARPAEAAQPGPPAAVEPDAAQDAAGAADAADAADALAPRAAAADHDQSPPQGRGADALASGAAGSARPSSQAWSSREDALLSGRGSLPAAFLVGADVSPPAPPLAATAPPWGGYGSTPAEAPVGARVLSAMPNTSTEGLAPPPSPEPQLMASDLTEQAPARSRAIYRALPALATDAAATHESRGSSTGQTWASSGWYGQVGWARRRSTLVWLLADEGRHR
jgi:hypothetical protein